MGARDSTVEPLSIGVTWLHVGDVGAVKRVVEAVLSFGVDGCLGVGISRTGSDVWCVGCLWQRVC